MATNIKTVGTVGSKSSRYLRMSEGLGTVSREYSNNVADNQSANAILSGVGSAVAGIGTAFANPWISTLGYALTGVTNIIAGLLARDNQKRADASANASKYMAEYANALTERDTLITSTMRQIDSGRQQMRAQYGDEFESMLYDFYLAQNGITPTTYSLMTGNFNTFENIGYGNTSGNNKLGFKGFEVTGDMDALTQGDGNIFNNMYRSISAGDLKPIINDLVKALYGSDSTIGMQLKSYEVEARQILEEGLASQNDVLIDAEGNLNTFALTRQQENISSAEQMGSAQAGRASSGMRGGTTSNNERLVQLQKDLSEMRGMAQASIVLRSLQASIRKIQSNTAYSVLTNRLNQRAIVEQTKANATANLSAMGATVAETEHQGNLDIESAKIYGQEIENYKREYRSDYDRMIGRI